MTALAFVTEYLIQKLKSLPDKSKKQIIEDLYHHDSWKKFIKTIKSNEDDSVKWVLLELGSWNKLFDFRKEIVEEDWESDEPVYVIFKFEDKFIKITSSDFDFKNYGYRKVEFDFVELVEILVPKKIWQTIES